jgi:hypothetical protein
MRNENNKTRTAGKSIEPRNLLEGPPATTLQRARLKIHVDNKATESGRPLQRKLGVLVANVSV